jgi:predicted metal-binding membrane protein
MYLRGDPIPLVPLTAAMLVAWAIMVIAGRLPVDAGMLAATTFFITIALHPDLKASHINPDVWFISAVALSSVGLRQHFAFSAIKAGPKQG